MKFKRRSNDTFTLSQPHLIDLILCDLKLINGKKKRAKPKRTLYKANTILRKDQHLPKHCASWEYHWVIGKLNFLEKSTRPDISYAMHQCARYSIDPRASHSEAVLRIGMYLLATQDKGIIMAPKQHSFDCWVDADSVGNWAKESNPLDIDNV